MNYRVYEHTDEAGNTDLGILGVWYDEDGTILRTTDPEAGSQGPIGKDIDDLRADIARLSQALESPILYPHNLPGHPEFVNVDETTALRSSGSPVEAFDDGSAPEVLDDAPVEGGAEPGPDADVFEGGPEGDPEAEVEPDPDAQHDDPGEGQ